MKNNLKNIKNILEAGAKSPSEREVMSFCARARLRDKEVERVEKRCEKDKGKNSLRKGE